MNPRIRIPCHPFLCVPIAALIATSTQLGAATLSGKVEYADSQSGPISISAVRQDVNNRVLHLDGERDFVRIPSVTDLSGSEISIQYWFRGASFQSAVRQQGGGWIVAGWNGTHILSHDGGTGGIAAGKANDGSWHHVMLTWKQGAAKGFASYLDGKLVEARDAVDSAIPNHNSALYFGSFQGVAEFTTGELDEIAVWRRALPPEEVQANWFRRLTGSEEGLVGYWPFDGDDGLEVADLSPNGNVGSLGGDATLVDAAIPGLEGAFETVVAAPGAYSIVGVSENADYQIRAFMDVNGNQRFDTGEPFGVRSGPITVTGDQVNLDILLQESPQFSQQPQGGRLLVGSSLQLKAIVRGSQPRSYRWFKNDIELKEGGRISGTSTPTLSIANAQESDSGAYRLDVSNPVANVTSDTVVIAVQPGGAMLSGDVTYAGEQKGKLIVLAEQVLAGNQVLRLDGAGSVETTLTDISGSELSVQYWFRGPTMQSVVRQQSGVGYMVAGWNGLHILSNDGGTGGVTAGSKATDGAWHQVIFTWKVGTPSGFKTFLDGQLIAQRDSSPNPILNLNASVFFGAFAGVGEFAKGDVDEIAIWNRALTDTEVAIGWNRPLSGGEDQLIGFWNFDSGAATDLSVGAHDGTLRGNARIVPADISGFGGQTLRTTRDGIGAWEIGNVQAGPNFKVSAFLDSNDNGVQDSTEASGDYEGNPFSVSGDKSDIHVVLTEAPRLISFTPQARGPAGAASVSLTVEAMGSGTLSYQWESGGIPLEDGARISGSRSKTLQISGLNSGDEGLYRVNVSNARGEFKTPQARVIIVEAGKKIQGTLNVAGAVNGPIIVKASQLNLVADNQVLQLDGNNDTAVIPDLKNLSGEAITILYWFRGPSDHSAVRQQGAGFLVAGWNGQHILSNDGGTGGVLAGPNINDGSWHRVAMTWQREIPGGFAAYLDGNLVSARDSGPNPIPNINAPLYFGSFNAAGEYAKGQLDDIAIFDRSLSEFEMFTLWNQLLTGAEDGLIGLWNFNDGTVTDLSTYGRNGDLINGASIVPELIPRLGGGEFTSILSDPGAFSILDLPSGSNYHLTAFIDANHNGQADADEAVGSYSSNPFELAGDLSGVVLNLRGPRDPSQITFSRLGANLELRWPTVTGLRLQESPTLAPASWTSVAGVVGSVHNVPLAEASRFYRLIYP